MHFFYILQSKGQKTIKMFIFVVMFTGDTKSLSFSCHPIIRKYRARPYLKDLQIGFLLLLAGLKSTEEFTE